MTCPYCGAAQISKHNYSTMFKCYTLVVHQCKDNRRHQSTLCQYNERKALIKWIKRLIRAGNRLAIDMYNSKNLSEWKKAKKAKP